MPLPHLRTEVGSAGENEKNPLKLSLKKNNFLLNLRKKAIKIIYINLIIKIIIAILKY